MKNNWLLFNPITTHRNARWFALIAFLAGHTVLLVGKYLANTYWTTYFCLALGLMLWIIPVMWIGKMYATSSKR